LSDKPAIERYFTDVKFLRIGRDFKNLINIVKESRGKYSLQFRNDDSFNVYYRGSSLAKVRVPSRGRYTVEISSAFVKGSVEESLGAGKATKDGSRRQWPIDDGDDCSFFTKTNMTQLCEQITEVNHQEEPIFEQVLMTDNPPNRHFVIIDCQVKDHKWRKKLDLLALVRPSGGGAFKFLVIENKLGNKSELRDSVAGQLKLYVDHIREYINDYVACYTRNYAQKYQLGLIDFEGAHDLPPSNVSI